MKDEKFLAECIEAISAYPKDSIKRKIQVCEETRKDRKFAYMTRNCQPRPKNSLINEYEEVIGDGGMFLQFLLREKAEHDLWKAKHLLRISKRVEPKGAYWLRESLKK